ncbi:WD40 repeat-like protein [Gymnopus androsaceus JB14]|uniref:WD repeat-containing protein JIP5 n=1 Tax=Gymnopus androsaceus JB14 TaxID=1447944 RepID=A0A6A4I4X4_9AGAR|nr:WD40 repeat-like protein [Gymnopus androsaceus JB14]
MTDVSVGAQIFDLVFHPSHSTVYTALLNGKVKAFAYDQQGRHKEVFSVKLSQKSCRGIAINEAGDKLYTVGKGKGLHTIDTVTGKLLESRAKAHEVAINRVKHVNRTTVTGDDDGIIKGMQLWDPRTKDSVRKYTHHFDYITDFLWLDDKKQLVATSGDGTLSVIDVRAKTTEPAAQSEDQEDELLSIVPIKGATKIVVGTQLGILSVFNRSSGWGDCVDRIPGHPHSVDALCALPASLPNVDPSSTILTGSSDGFVRAVSVFPTQLQGVVADHGEWPVERIAVGEGMSELTVNQGGDRGDNDDSNREDLPGHYWAGSAGHDELLKLTNLASFFNGQNAEVGVDERQDNDDADGGDGISIEGGPDDSVPFHAPHGTAKEDSDEGSSDVEPEASKPRKRKKKEKDPLVQKKKKGRNEVEVEGGFFAEL